MSKKQILKERIKLGNQSSKLTKTDREELRFRRSLLCYRECLLDQMKRRFDRVLSARLAAADFLLSSGREGKNK